MFKLRTLDRNAEKQGPSSTRQDDPRITRAGRSLRTWKLDELPQMYNVLRGDMSLVGPRPQVSWAVGLYTAEERRILIVRPGITDYASIRFRNEAELLRGRADADEAYLKDIAPLKNRLALSYVSTASFAGDLRILWMTIRTALPRYQTEGSDDGKGRS